MPPKRKAAAKNVSPATNTKAAKATSRKTRASKVDNDDDDEPAPKMQRKDSHNTQIKKAFEKLKGKEKEAKRNRAKLDEHYSTSGADDEIYEDYACMLNQTNINANNNKFYVIQLVERKKAKKFGVFTRWGRVGEPGQNNTSEFKVIDGAIKEFKKKFKDKTKNDWDNREDFKPYSGKYTLLEMNNDDDSEEDEESPVKTEKSIVCGTKIAPSKLDKLTLDFIKRIFNDDMFNNAMENFNLDIKKMPLGKLSKAQISKGFDVLVAIEDCLKSNKSKPKQLESLSSEFYTLIPHSFGRNRPVVLDSSFLVGKKKEMLLVLSDIELTQTLQKNVQAKINDELQPNPWDEKYDLLHCNLSSLPKSAEEYKVIQTYFTQTKGDYSWVKIKIENIWKVDRHDEGNRFDYHDKIKERKLLWHGTNIAVVAAILSSGLRIMPHSGGRVGKGIYFASEQSKSFGYTSCDRDRVYVMFLNEVALGKEHTITKDDCSLKQAPSGYDCVVARGSKEPDPKLDTTIVLDGKEIVVPQGKPIITKFTDSSFDQSEYLVYKESQVRIRYVIVFTETK